MMRVNVIVQGRGDADPTRILPRMAQTLADGTGWKITTAERAGPADLNYYMSYRYRPLLEPFATYFFHLWNDGMVQGEGRPQDMRPWNESAARASLRVVTAKQYGDMLRPFGPTVQIRPPLDREKFVPINRGDTPLRRRMLAGVAGYVPRDGRKGERQLVEVMASEDGRQLDWMAIGQGWPAQITTTHLPIDKVQEFYQNLDVYVCTSVCEGVPYPPLEALACGIPIIIPKGVGLLDDLPDIPGIYRYERGDVQSLRMAVGRFNANRWMNVEPEELREATAPYTAEGWIEGHVKAFASLDLSNTYSPLVSVIVVTSDVTLEQTRHCLACLSCSSIPYELIIVQNQRDWSFAKRVNQGIAASRGDYILLLNDDCFVKPDTIQKLLATCSRSEVGVVGGLLSLADGRVQHAGGYIDWNKQKAGNIGRGTRQVFTKATECDFITGALLMIKRSVVAQIGLMDEHYEATYEDVDWCVRAARAGYHIVFDPAARATHLESATIRNDMSTARQRFQASHDYFWRQYGSERPKSWRERRLKQQLTAKRVRGTLRTDEGDNHE
jgi:hypothetical protein